MMSGIYVIVLMYVIAGGVMWLLACQIAPIGHKIELGSSVAVVIFLGFIGVGCQLYLVPEIGTWASLVQFLASVILIKKLFRLSLLRSAACAIVYSLFILVATIYMLS